MMAAETEVEVRCALCKSDGPPLATALDLLAAAAMDSHAEVGSNLIWISCDKCTTWYHSVCLLLADEETRQTVPVEVREEVELNHSGQGAWTNWVGWIDRW